MKRLTFLLLTLAPACGGAPAKSPPPKALPQQADRALPWVEDDLDGALAHAKAQHVPVFVDAWALWCHSCLSMKKYVLSDASLAPLADRFVWAEIDTEKPKNEGFVVKY